MTDERMTDLLKKAFELEQLEHSTYVGGILSGLDTKYFIPEENMKRAVSDFPFIKNAIKAGLFGKEKKGYFVTNKVLAVRSTDKRKSRAKQFFSVKGDDEHERTTIHDLLVTMSNLRYTARKFGVSTGDIKFTIRYQNGDPNNVVNYVELDKKLFGNSDSEVEENLAKLNSMVKYERAKHSGEVVNG